MTLIIDNIEYYAKWPEENVKSIIKSIIFVLFLGCFYLNGYGAPFLDFGRDESVELKAEGARELEIGNESGEAQEEKPAPVPDFQKKAINWDLGIFAATILAGLFSRFKELRKLRGVFLVSSLVILGFVRGPCPCMISSFINMILTFFGSQKQLYLFLWFLGLIPLTYILGRVWCGWVCHLGAFQEFLFTNPKFPVLRSVGAKKTLKFLQYVLLATLITHLFITKTNIWCRIDPFLAGFSLFSATKIGLILLGITLLSSVLVFRPFCRGACPIGLILGWVSRIPGASILEDKSECIQCSVCSETCRSQAIDRIKEGEKISLLYDNRECNVCGECMSYCDKNAIRFTRTKLPKIKLFNPFKKRIKK